MNISRKMKREKEREREREKEGGREKADARNCVGYRRNNGVLRPEIEKRKRTG
jgi:hypothetical protein